MLFVNFLCSEHVYSSDPSKPEVVLVHVEFNWYNSNPSTNIICVTVLILCGHLLPVLTSIDPNLYKAVLILCTASFNHNVT